MGMRMKKHRDSRLHLLAATMFAVTCGLAPVPAGAQTAWLSPADGSWTNAANWSAGLPTASIDTTINVTGSPYIVSQSGGTITARTLFIDSANARLNLTGGALLNLSLTASSSFVLGSLGFSAGNIRGNLSLGSGFSLLQTGGTSSLAFNRNNGLIRGTGGTLTLRGHDLAWHNGAGATIEADGSTALVGFGLGGSGRWTNAGELIARNGAQFNIGGDTTTGEMGTLRLFDTARMNLTGTIDNTGAVLNGPDGGSFDANGGAITGGTIAAGAILLRPRIGSGVVGLDIKGDAVWQGDVAVFNNSVKFYSGATFTGTQLDASGFFGVTFYGPHTVSGKAITLSSTLPVTNAVNKTTLTAGLTETGGAATATFAADTTISGNDFTLAGSNSGTIVNQGLIRHLSGSSGTSSVGTVQNTGTIRADAGFFSLAPGTLINDGVLEARAGAVLALAVVAFTQTATGELRGAGQINLNTPISGGTLRPGDNAGIGTLTIQSPFGQPATFTGPTTFAIEVAGGTADQLFFNNGSKGVELGSGNVSLALTLTSPPTAETYRIVNLPAGFQNLFSGTFAGLPHGSTITASHAGTDYAFTIEYDTKGVTLRLPPASSPPALTGAVSRKTHGASGTYDAALDFNAPISGAVTVESRSIGAGHLVVFQFDQSIAMPGTATAVDAFGASIGAVSTAVSGNEVLVTLTGVPDNQRVTISLAGVTSSSGGTTNAATSAGFLVGDVNNSRSVNATDISGVKARSGQTTDSSNFRFDLNASGGINATDISAVKARSGLVLP